MATISATLIQVATFWNVTPGRTPDESWISVTPHDHGEAARAAAVRPAPRRRNTRRMPSPPARPAPRSRRWPRPTRPWKPKASGWIEMRDREALYSPPRSRRATAAYIAGDVSDPARSLPRAMFLGNAGWHRGLRAAQRGVRLHDADEQRWRGRLNVAQVAGEHIFGATGGRVVDGPYLPRPRFRDQRDDVDRPARDGGDGRGRLAAQRICSLNSRSGVPVEKAILLQISVVTLLLHTPKLRSGARLHPVQPDALFIPGGYAGVIVLRVTQPGEPRPYKVTGLSR